MDVREFPVLDSDDELHIDRLAAGLGENPARVFVYLWRRRSQPDISPVPATEMEIQIGTELSRKASQDAISVLKSRNLVTTTTVETTTPGRPPNAWKPRESLESTLERTYLHHAELLLTRAAEMSGVGEGVDSVEQRTEKEPAVTVGLNWDPNGLQLPLYAALANGYYSSHGLAVTQQAFTGSRQAVEAVASNDVTVGIAGAATVARARVSGLPVVPIAVLFQRPMVVVYTTREQFGEPLTRVAQLRGRRVGMPVPSEASMLGQLFLSQANILDDVEVIDVGGEEESALQSGRVDAVTGMFADPMRLETGGTTVDSLHIAKQYPIYGPTFIVTEDTVKRERERLVKFLAGTTAGWAAAKEAPEEAARHVVAADTHTGPVVSVFEQAVEEFGTTDTVSRHGWGWQSPETWQRIETALRQSNLLEEDT